jgi:hypothetical protein
LRASVGREGRGNSSCASCDELGEGSLSSPEQRAAGEGQGQHAGGEEAAVSRGVILFFSGVSRGVIISGCRPSGVPGPWAMGRGLLFSLSRQELFPA